MRLVLMLRFAILLMSISFMTDARCIFQPHVRPIVRGKSKAPTEFGAKIGAAVYEGYTFIDHHSWDAYNESTDLSLQIQLFKERFGYLPATILAGKIYMNHANRRLLKEYEIKTYCKP